MQVLLLKQPFTISLSGNPIPISLAVAPYTTGAALLDYRIQIRILIENIYGSGQFTEVKSGYFLPDVNGQLQIDIQSIIHPYLDYYTPHINLPQMVLATGQYKRYQFAFNLQLAGVAVAVETFSSILYAIKGGMAYDQWHPTDWFYSYLIGRTNFLGYTTGTEKTTPNAASFLFFLAPANDTYTLSAVIIDDSGTSYTYTMPTTIVAPAWAVVCLPSCYSLLGLQSLLPVGSFAVKYTVIITGATAGLVAQRLFKFDYRNFYNVSAVCYRNSLGGLETLFLRGQVDFEADYAIQAATQMVPPSYYNNLQIAAQMLQIVEESPKYNGDTGFLDRETADKLRDFFLSPQRFEFVEYKMVPIVLVNKSVKFFGNRDNLISIQLQWQRAYFNEYYSQPGSQIGLGRSCPALEQLIVTQVSKSEVQVMYSLAIPYDIVEVSIAYLTSYYTKRFVGNTGVVKFQFDNPTNATNFPMAISAATICDATSLVVSKGPSMQTNISILSKSLPVVINDTYTINSGYTTAVTMPFSVLANDYDPDGLPINVVAAAGLTNAGAAYSISTNGTVIYTPLSATYNGNDFVDYQVIEPSTGTIVTGRIFFNVGGSVAGVVFAKMVIRNSSTSTNRTDAAHGAYSITTITIAEVYFDYFSDAAAQNPLDVTGLGLSINYNKIIVDTIGNTSGTTSLVAAGSNYSMLIYQGQTNKQVETHPANGGNVFTYQTITTFVLQAGTGYGII